MHSLVLRLVSPIVFLVPGHGARKFFAFARAEHGSMLDLRLAAARTTSPSRGARYLRHALDEARHTQMFAARSAELRRERGLLTLGVPIADTEHLFETLGELRFLAFVHRGEQRGRGQFEVYRRLFAGRGDAKTRAMFDAIIDDEKVHESYTRALLVELAGSERAARRELAKAAAWEAWRTWRRLGRFLAQGAYRLAMLVVYVAVAPLSLVVRLARPERRGWVEKA